MLLRLAILMAQREEGARPLMVLEQGKPLAEARVEIAYALSFSSGRRGGQKRLDGAVVPAPWPDKRIVVTREPVGVTAGITPWNFPSAMVTRKSRPALAAGWRCGSRRSRRRSPASPSRRSPGSGCRPAS